MQPTTLQIFTVMNGLMACLMSLITFSLRKHFPNAIHGLKEWVYFPIFAFLSSLLYSLQGFVHHLVSMALPNVLLVLAIMAQATGVFKYYGVPYSRRIAGAFLVVSLVFFIFTSGQPEFFQERVAYVSASMTIILWSEVRLIWKHRADSFAAKMLLFVIAWLSTVMVVRFVTIWSAEDQTKIFDFSLIQALYLASFGFGVVLLSISGILLATEKVHAEIENLLRHDVLTGAKSRLAIVEIAAYEFGRAQRATAPFSVLLMDIDHFKAINDQFGHQTGDRVLKEFTLLVKDQLRKPAEVGRYGGEEFLVTLPDTRAEDALKVAQRISQALQQSALDPKVTVSIGLAQVQPGQDPSLEALIDRADQALYEAKKAGRDRIIAASL